MGTDDIFASSTDFFTTTQVSAHVFPLVHPRDFLTLHDARCGFGVAAHDTRLLDPCAAAFAVTTRPEGASRTSALSATQGAADDTVAIDAFDTVRASLVCFVRGENTQTRPPRRLIVGGKKSS